MKKIYIISTCLNIKKDYSEFHFKGFLKGEKIKKIRLDQTNFELDENYLIKIKKPVVKQQVLYGKCVKFKKLFC